MLAARHAVWLGIAALAAMGSATAIVARAAFNERLDSLDRRLASAARSTVERADLPAAASALALKIGVPQGAAPRVVRMNQVGSMWQSPDGTEIRFKARQVIAVSEPGFLWRADFGPFGLAQVADYFVNGAGGLEGRFLGVIPLVTLVASDQAAKGEIMRYLAELPWAPDAIQHNRALEWRQLDDETLAVAAGSGAARGEVRFLLDADGLIVAVEADDRPRLEGKAIVERPWRCRLWDYREIEGRKIPMRGEASWLLDAAEVAYWRGTVTHWTMKLPGDPRAQHRRSALSSLEVIHESDGARCDEDATAPS